MGAENAKLVLCIITTFMGTVHFLQWPAVHNLQMGELQGCSHDIETSGQKLRVQLHNKSRVSVVIVSRWCACHCVEHALFIICDRLSLVCMLLC